VSGHKYDYKYRSGLCNGRARVPIGTERRSYEKHPRHARHLRVATQNPPFKPGMPHSQQTSRDDPTVGPPHAQSHHRPPHHVRRRHVHPPLKARPWLRTVTASVANRSDHKTAWSERSRHVFLIFPGQSCCASGKRCLRPTSCTPSRKCVHAHAHAPLPRLASGTVTAGQSSQQRNDQTALCVDLPSYCARDGRRLHFPIPAKWLETAKTPTRRAKWRQTVPILAADPKQSLRVL
jgi:hypothetical protein